MLSTFNAPFQNDQTPQFRERDSPMIRTMLLAAKDLLQNHRFTVVNMHCSATAHAEIMAASRVVTALFPLFNISDGDLQEDRFPVLYVYVFTLRVFYQF